MFTEWEATMTRSRHQRRLTMNRGPRCIWYVFFTHFFAPKASTKWLFIIRLLVHVCVMATDTHIQCTITPSHLQMRGGAGSYHFSYVLHSCHVATTTSIATHHYTLHKQRGGVASTLSTAATAGQSPLSKPLERDFILFI
jgi:hypothetical protein